MPISILMPALSPTMEEGNLAKWHVKEGEKVEIGSVVAEIETDKATMEVESVDEGIIGKIFVEAGTEGVKVNELLAVLLEEGEDTKDIDIKNLVSKKSSPSTTNSEPKTDSKADKKSKIVPETTPSQAKSTNKSRVFSSPLARRIASQSNIDIAQIEGTGPHGRIIKRDVESFLALDPSKRPTASRGVTAEQLGISDDAVIKLFEEGSYEIIPHDNMRKTIAKRLTESKQSIPHFYLSVDCELDKLLELRTQINESAPVDSDGKPEFKLSVNDLIIKAHALALIAVPDANASWTDAGMLIHKHADIGVAVAIDGGLITPIIRKAEEKKLSVISAEMKDLATRARSRKLMPEEYQGGSTAISNLGMFGIKDFSAVINPPHATILAVGAGLQQPVVKNGELKVATVMTVTLSTDHRAVDGVLGAQLLQAFKGYIETPVSMLV